MNEQIVIVGSGDMLAAKTALFSHSHKDVIVVSPDEIVQEPFPKSEPFIIHNTYSYEFKREGKLFSCKGKHQYRKSKVKEELNEGTFIKVSWVCQCGKVLGS